MGREDDRREGLGGNPVAGSGRARREPGRPPSRVTHTILTGTWKVERNELVESGGGGRVYLGDAAPSSYDLRFKGQILSGEEGFVALFHSTAPGRFRFFHVGELNGKRVVAGFVVDGKEGGPRSTTNSQIVS